MKLIMNTHCLQELVARSIKGSSDNKLVPITSLMAIELKDNVFTLTTTDGVNYLYIRKSEVKGDDFYAVVLADTFSKLISRMTCDTVILSKCDNNLEVSGNGRYSIELPVDERGEFIKFPDPTVSFTEDSVVEISNSIISRILANLKPALAVTLENPCYTGYYLGQEVIATDSYKIASLKAELLEGPELISSSMMDLLSVMTADSITCKISGKNIMFDSPDCTVFGPVMDDIEEFQVQAIRDLVDEGYPSLCKISKVRLLQILDRLSLFVSPYDKNGIYLTFIQDGMSISSKASTGVESIPFIESRDFVDFTCCIDIEMLMSQVKSITSDIIDLSYGLDTAIKIKDGDITHVIALLEDDRATL